MSHFNCVDAIWTQHLHVSIVSVALLYSLISNGICSILRIGIILKLIISNYQGGTHSWTNFYCFFFIGKNLKIWKVGEEGTLLTISTVWRIGSFCSEGNVFSDIVTPYHVPYSERLQLNIWEEIRQCRFHI